MILNQDFKEFIQLLNEHKVKYLVIGGYALAYHGYPRFTQDIDFWIWTEQSNIDKILTALSDFGFASLNLNRDDLQNSENVIQLGYPPNRIDIVTQADGVDFEEAYEHKISFKDESITIDFISVDSLIKNKRATGRLQDLADIEMLEKIKKKKDKS